MTASTRIRFALMKALEKSWTRAHGFEKITTKSFSSAAVLSSRISCCVGHAVRIERHPLSRP